MFFRKYKYISYSERRQIRFKIFRILFVIFFIFILQLLIKSYILTTYRIQSETMNPVFSSGDMIISSPLYTVQEGIERGTLVVVEPFEKPHIPAIKKVIRNITVFTTFQMFSPFEENTPMHAKPFVRRIVGLPGDTIYMKDFVLHVKTKNSTHFLTEFEISEKDYNVKMQSLPEHWDESLPFSGTYPEITLKEDEYFVLCDNRIAAGDSRLWGPLHADTQIKSRILLRYWPPAQFSFF